jgi:methionyl-tRNA formyltransferase
VRATVRTTPPPSARRRTPSPEPAARPPASRSIGRPARTVFFGSGGFALPILEALIGAPDVEVVGVVTAPDRPAGRGVHLSATPVARRARELGLPLLQPARIRDDEAMAAVAAVRPELGILADYGRIIPAAVLDVPAYGILNVHPSLLPRHRGATPIPAAILAGDAETGVTLIRMDTGLDSGPIVAAEGWPLVGDETAPQVAARAAVVGAKLVLRSLAGWLAGSLSVVPQDDAAATLTRPLRREDGRLDVTCSARYLERVVRAYQPWPGAFLDTAIGRLAVVAAAVGPAEAADSPGRLVRDGDGLALATAEGRLRLIVVRLAGSRELAAAEFLRGRGRGLVDSPVA